ncbi:MAG: hypothetical protein NZT92_01505 [Abditibacteriales bacterium]|nr:hypothetical protein [Abditibacteriales bacterium]MDW8364841.1 hypothetical protein [Abditibacteriales bacterium]
MTNSSAGDGFAALAATFSCGVVRQRLMGDVPKNTADLMDGRGHGYPTHPRPFIKIHGIAALLEAVSETLKRSRALYIFARRGRVSFWGENCAGKF